MVLANSKQRLTQERVDRKKFVAVDDRGSDATRIAHRPDDTLAGLHRLLTDEEAHAEIDIPIAQIAGAIFKLLGAWKQRCRNRRVVVKPGIGLALGVDKEFGKTSKRRVHDLSPASWAEYRDGTRQGPNTKLRKQPHAK